MDSRDLKDAFEDGYERAGPDERERMRGEMARVAAKNPLTEKWFGKEALDEAKGNPRAMASAAEMIHGEASALKKSQLERQMRRLLPVRGPSAGGPSAGERARDASAHPSQTRSRPSEDALREVQHIRAEEERDAGDPRPASDVASASGQTDGYAGAKAAERLAGAFREGQSTQRAMIRSRLEEVAEAAQIGGSELVQNLRGAFPSQAQAVRAARSKIAARIDGGDVRRAAAMLYKAGGHETKKTLRSFGRRMRVLQLGDRTGRAFASKTTAVVASHVAKQLSRASGVGRDL